MPLDPNIILGQKQVQIQNPLEAASTALSMKALAQRTQMQDQEIGDQQAVRRAYQNNTQIGPDGTPSLNRASFMSDLAQRNPQLAIQKQQELSQQDLALREQKMKSLADTVNTGKLLLSQVPTGEGVPDDQKQKAWTQLKAKSAELGLPNVDQMPDQYPGDQHVNMMMTHLMTAEEQLAQHNKDREFQQKSQEISYKHEENQVKREYLQNSKQGQALQQTSQMLESARGAPEVSQAQKDLYAAKKFESLANLYGDPNKLNPQQVQLAASEVAKIAQGGVPQSSELQHLTPNSVPGTLAEIAQKFTNSPTPANQGAFINAMRDYTNSLKGDAKDVIRNKYSRVLETQKGRIGDDNYQNLKSNYLDPLDETHIYNGVTYKQMNGHWVPQNGK